jgi:hypothetical protein
MLPLSIKDLDFEKDPRRIQEKLGRPYANDIYKKVFGSDINIIRFDKSDEYLLDKKFAIDVQLTFLNGLILTGQEKFLSNYCAKYNSVTVEYEQNQYTGEPGDWYKLAVQIYFTGYLKVNGEGFCNWVILNWPSTVVETERGNIKWIDNKNKNGRALASFKYTDIDTIPLICKIARERI